MAHVSVTINNRHYRMACDDGHEDHLAQLAHDLDQRIAHLRTTFGEIGDMRLTVMAALIVADELSELRQSAHKVEEELTGLRRARDGAETAEADIAAAFNSAAERIEKAAMLLGQTNDGHRAALG
jgi:cell division protein ZapA